MGGLWGSSSVTSVCAARQHGRRDRSDVGGALSWLVVPLAFLGLRQAVPWVGRQGPGCEASGAEHSVTVADKTVKRERKLLKFPES